MKRQCFVKLLFVAAVVLSHSIWADVAPLYDYRPMSHAEWSMPLLRPGALSVVIPCVVLGIFLLAVCVSTRRRSPNAMIWLACFASVFFWLGLPLSAFDSNCFILFALSTFGGGALSWIVAVFWLAFEKKMAKATCLFFIIPLLFFGSRFAFSLVAKYSNSNGSRMLTFDACHGETYEEYLKRYRREYRHYCPDRDKPMQSGYCLMRYWYCERCGRGKKEYEVALRECELRRSGRPKVHAD